VEILDGINRFVNIFPLVKLTRLMAGTEWCLIVGEKLRIQPLDATHYRLRNQQACLQMWEAYQLVTADRAAALRRSLVDSARRASHFRQGGHIPDCPVRPGSDVSKPQTSRRAFASGANYVL
jgi:hypothetical protein